jgi:hypothetical protein
MDQWIASANIDHFRELLRTETDEPKRQVLLNLLDMEILRLAEAKRKKRQPNFSTRANASDAPRPAGRFLT